VLPLDERLPTLAELMGRAGYRSIAVSGNPVISDETGLSRGFDVAVRAQRFGELYGDRLIRAVEETLAQEPPDAPLFLFVNIADAHHPWPGIPDDVDWLPARAGLGYAIKAADSPWRRYMAGELDQERADALIAHHTDLYDWGIRRADATLGAVLALLEEQGRLRGGHRIVITSDHGEFLGQHGLTGHCCYAYEAVTRVPFVVLSSAGPLELPRPLAALHAHHLLRDGRFPDAGGIVSAVAYPSANLARHVGRFGGELSVALWQGREKLLWVDGRVALYALDRDPQELQPRDASGHPLRARLEALAQSVRLAAVPATGSGDGEALRQLEALGYVE
jgi:arylsulfatase A-like enzyme